MFKDCPSSKDGLPYVHWIHQLFGSCVYGSRGAASFFLGYATIACWLNAQLPQLITNYKNQSVDGLSLPFLLNWLLGDITNLVGCILTDQLPFQVYLASYFCAVDLALFFQYFYYTYYHRPPIIEEEVNLGEEPDEHVAGWHRLADSIFENGKKSYTFPSRRRETHERSTSLVLFALFLFTFHATSTLSPSYSVSSSHSTPPLRAVDNHNVNELSVYPVPPTFLKIDGKSVGRIFAWTCTILYLTSRMPQIWMNYKRKSVEGLSIYMFIFAALGNLTYTLSIFANPAASKDPLFFDKSLPYLLGATGTLTFDLTIYIQWWQYRGRPPKHRRHSYSWSLGHERRDPNIYGSYRSARSHRSGKSHKSGRSHRSSRSHRSGGSYKSIPTTEAGCSLLDPHLQGQEHGV